MHQPAKRPRVACDMFQRLNVLLAVYVAFELGAMLLLWQFLALAFPY